MKTQKIKIFYEVQFDNNPNKFDRISAVSEQHAKEKMQKFYPNCNITKITKL